MVLGVILFTLIFIVIGFSWKNLSNFFHDNYSFFEFFFIILFFIEQLTFVMLVNFFPNRSELFISIFALIVITTASLQKMMMDRKDQRSSQLVTRYKDLVKQSYEGKEKIAKEHEDALEMIRSLKEGIKKSRKA